MSGSRINLSLNIFLLLIGPSRVGYLHTARWPKELVNNQTARLVTIGYNCQNLRYKLNTADS